LRASSGIRTALGLILRFATCSVTLFAEVGLALPDLESTALSSCAPLVAWELRGKLLAQVRLTLPDLESAALSSCAPLMVWELLGKLLAEIELCCALSGLCIPANAVQNKLAIKMECT
jgi:hypothetical protein